MRLANFEQSEQSEQIEQASRNSPNQRVHFFAEFSHRGPSKIVKVASDEVNAPVRFGLRLCDTKKITDQILGDQSKIAATRLRFNPRTKEYFVDAIVKVPKTSEKKEGINIVMGNDPGITPMDTVYIGSTGECFHEKMEGNGGRNLLFKKAERVTELEEQLRKMSWSELKARQIEENRPNPRTRKQWCRSKRKLKKRLEKARVVLRNYRKIFHYSDINATLAKGDKYVHNKLNSKRILMESKQTYDGPGRKARTNASILAYGEYTERLKWKIRTTEGKTYVTGAGERGTTKTCLYCWQWNPKLKLSEKVFTCRNRRCGQVYGRDPGSAMHNTMEGCQALLERPRRNARRVCRRVE